MSLLQGVVNSLQTSIVVMHRGSTIWKEYPHQRKLPLSKILPERPHGSRTACTNHYTRTSVRVRALCLAPVYVHNLICTISAQESPEEIPTLWARKVSPHHHDKSYHLATTGTTGISSLIVKCPPVHQPTFLSITPSRESRSRYASLGSHGR